MFWQVKFMKEGKFLVEEEKISIWREQFKTKNDRDEIAIEEDMKEQSGTEELKSTLEIVKSRTDTSKNRITDRDSKLEKNW